MWSSCRYTLGSAWQNYRRNLAVSLAGTFTMGLILLVVGMIALLSHGANGLLEQQQRNASKIRIYLNDGVSLASITEFKVGLQHDPRIRTVTFQTKDQALANAGTDLNDAVKVLGRNPLPASFQVDVRELADLSSVDNMARGYPIVDRHQATDLKQDVINTLQSIITGLGVAGIVASLVLGFISLVIIMNTIRTAVYIRREEIEIMKLVGASNWFVRWPFLLEGMLGGVIGAAFASLVVWQGYRYTLGHLPDIFKGISYDSRYLALTVVMLFVAGAAIGVFGSFLGIRRFLTA